MRAIRLFTVLSCLMIVSCKQKEPKTMNNLVEARQEAPTATKTAEVIATASTQKITSEMVFASERNIDLSNAANLEYESTNDWSCATKGARDAYYIGTGDGFRELHFQFTDSDWSGITNTCGWNEPSNGAFTAPWPQFNKYQMFVEALKPDGSFLMYPPCEEGAIFNIDTKPGYRYYVYVNDTDGDHVDNHGTISFCWGYK